MISCGLEMVGSWTFSVRATIVALAVGLLPRVAGGMVMQPPPGNEAMPQPTPAAEILIITSRGFPADAVTLAGLFKYFEGGADSAIEPVRDAQGTNGGAGSSSAGGRGGTGGAKSGGGCGCHFVTERGGRWSLLLAFLLLGTRRRRGHIAR